MDAYVEINAKVKQVFVQVCSNINNVFAPTVNDIIGSSVGDATTNLQNHVVYHIADNGDRMWLGMDCYVIEFKRQKFSWYKLRMLTDDCVLVDRNVKIDDIYPQTELTPIFYVMLKEGYRPVRFLIGCPNLSNADVINLIENSSDIAIKSAIEMKAIKEENERLSYIKTLKKPANCKIVDYNRKPSVYTDKLRIPYDAWMAVYPKLYKTGTPYVVLVNPELVKYAEKYERNVPINLAFLETEPTTTNPAILYNFDNMTLTTAFYKLVLNGRSYDDIFFNFVRLLKTMSEGKIINNTVAYTKEFNTQGQLNACFNCLSYNLSYIYQFGNSVNIYSTPGQIFDDDDLNYVITDKYSRETIEIDVLISSFLNIRPKKGPPKNYAVYRLRKYMLAVYRIPQTLPIYKFLCAVYNTLYLNKY